MNISVEKGMDLGKINKDWLKFFFSLLICLLYKDFSVLRLSLNPAEDCSLNFGEVELEVLCTQRY